MFNKTLVVNFFSALAFIFGLADVAAAEKISFAPLHGVLTEVVVQDQSVKLSVTSGGETKSDEIEVETDKKIKVSLGDYNFDGVQDFSISHLDDGMGTYTVYQIFVYSVKDRKFVALHPKCGDEFINIAVSKKTRTLTNSYFIDNQMKTCVMKF